jgi:hypothetical protein
VEGPDPRVSDKIANVPLRGVVREDVELRKELCRVWLLGVLRGRVEKCG